MEPKPARRGDPIGPIVGIMVIVLVLVVGAIYFIVARTERPTDTLPLIQGDASTSSSPYTP